MTAITLKNLEFSYDRAPTLSRMNIEILSGTVTAILGANGAGKTTLLSLLLGRYTADKGEILFWGKPVATYERRRIKQMIGMVSQNETLPFDLSVAEYVLLGRAPHLKTLALPGPRDRQAADRALSTVGMTHMAQSIMTHLSSGERQLVHVARSLAQAPKMLLLDEPTSHLDLINSRKILHLVRSIAQEGRTVVFTTHDPNAAATVAHQVILLKNGTVLATGSPNQTLTPKLLTKTYGDKIEVITTPRGPLVLTL